MIGAITLGYDHLLAKNHNPDRRHAEPPGFECWVGPLRSWAKEWAREMESWGHHEREIRRILPRLATNAILGRPCDPTHRGARLTYIRTISRIDPGDAIRCETFVCVVQRALEDHFRKGDSR